MVPSQPSRVDGEARAPASRRTFLRLAGATAGLGIAAGPAAGAADAGAVETTVGVSPAQRRSVDATLDRLPESVSSTVSLAQSESTDGFRQFATGDVDLLVASRPILAGEHARTRENDVEYETRELPTTMATLHPPESSWTDCLRPSRLAKAWASDGPIATWAEVPSDGAASVQESAAPSAETSGDDGASGSDEAPAYVRGVRSHQYATGFGGVGYYEPDPSWFADVTATSAGEGSATTLVQLSFLYGDRRVLDRTTVTDFLATYTQRSAEVVGDVPYYADPLGQ